MGQVTNDNWGRAQSVINQYNSITSAEYYFNPPLNTMHGRMRNKEFKTVLKNLDADYPPTEKPRALDIGCSGGRYTQALLNRGFDTHGLDTGRIPLLYAREKLKAGNFYQGSIAALPFQKDTFDLVICIELFHHLTDDILGNAVGQISSILKTNGVLIFDVKNSLNPLILAVYKKSSNIKWTLQPRSIRQMTRLVEQNGLKVTKKKGIFSPITLFAPIVIVFCKKV